MQILDLDFTLATNPQSFTLNAKSFGKVNKFIVYDSIEPDENWNVDFYPRCEFAYPDESALISESIGMYEEMEFAFSLGNDDIGRYENTFAWDGIQLLDTRLESHLSGTALFILKSINAKYDFPNKRTYSGSFTSALNQIAQEIKIAEYSSATNPLHISTALLNSGKWYRGGHTAKDFIKRHLKYAYAPDGSPFFSFVNSLGEFYFLSASELVNQFPINNNDPYILLDKDSKNTYNFTDSAVLHDYDLGILGSEINRPNYNKGLTQFNVTNGSFTTVTDTISAHLPQGQGKLPAPTSKLSTTTHFDKFGYNNNDTRQLYSGWKNNLFSDSVFSIKIKMRVKFNPKLAAGKNIVINFPSAKESARLAQEYSGTWTILQSKLIHERGLSPEMLLTVGRSRINFSTDNVFANSFIS